MNGRLGGHRLWHLHALLPQFISNVVINFVRKHVNDCVQGLFVLDVEVFLVELDYHVKELLIMLLHPITFEVVVLELILEIYHGPACAREFKNATSLFLRRWILATIRLLSIRSLSLILASIGQRVR
jgi:hypothetical protein